MPPDTPTTKSHLKAVFAACVVCTRQLKDTFESTGLLSMSLFQVSKSAGGILMLGLTSRMKNRG